MYANYILHTDVEPFEVLQSVNPKTKAIRRMTAEPNPAWKPKVHPGGFVAHISNNHDQQWIISSDETAPVILIRLHKDGRWRDKHGGTYRLSDKPIKFYDHNF